MAAGRDWQTKHPIIGGFLPLRIQTPPVHHAGMIGLNDAYAGKSATGTPSIDVEEAVRRIFAQGGLLQENLGLEHRPEQELMARRTQSSWQVDDALFFEAGTGVGKSLAYLVPGLIQAVTSERPLVVSTHTIALQEQLERKDLPLCRKLFESDESLSFCSGFKHAVLVGRGNYLCGTRLAQALKSKSELFPSNEQLELQRIADWARSTGTGLLQELDPQPLPEVWEWVHADGHACNNRNCSPKNCHFRRAREAVRQANVIIVNHSLLFALLSAGHFPTGKVPGILFPEDFMVIDEAHTLPAVATEYFGLRLSALGLRRQLLKLYQKRKPKARGLLARHGNPGLRNQVMALTEGASEYFKGIREAFLTTGRPIRLQTPSWHPNDLDIPLRDLVHSLTQLENRLEEGAERDELEGVRRALQTYREGINEIIELSDSQSVYWLETAGREGDRVYFRSAPLDIAPILRIRLFERCTGLLLTSATLAEGPDMDSFKTKLGAAVVPSEQAASPFDYPLQMEILIHHSAPEPSSDDGRLNTTFLAAQIADHALSIDGGTLALFTSYRDLLAVRTILEPRLRKAGRTLLCQGTGIGRSQLLQSFKELGNAILLGTDSFWTGVDVPGVALSQVIITRLPFENPTHPVAEARSELCRRQGKSPFAELTLPAALIKFRQGIGRLIRNHTDEGKLVILDSRIVTKAYGSLFLEVLPHDQYRKIP
jgi:ATP-dependent DNA helicase DinG